MIEAEFWDYEAVDELADAVAGDIGFIVESAVDARDAALLALPGDAPAAVLDQLAKAKLPWKKVAIIATDDLLVGVDSPNSRARALAQRFLPLGARVVPFGTPNSDVVLAGNAADARLADLPWPPDLAWLTVGAAGEVAGLADSPHLQNALDAPKARRAVGLAPDNGEPRVTLTRAALLSARTILITADGTDRKELLEGAIADGQSSKLPIGRLLAEAEQPIDIHWTA
ncbi:MAG TPA: 6-phosphogluconolactonase [Sphingomicrobium sp.]|jgi:6-phosphogluconolactonase|nr:6-phosphogluconolactonase [Sphingomicrobium sp.]